MQSVGKLSESGNVFKSSEPADDDLDAVFDSPGEAKKPAAAVPGRREESALRKKAAPTGNEKKRRLRLELRQSRPTMRLRG